MILMEIRREIVIRKKQPNSENIIDLTGSDGNAYVLLGIARKLSRQLSLDGAEIIKNMKSGDYENLIQVFDNAFGDYVILER